MMPSLLGNLAWLLHSKGQFDEALDYYNQARQELRAAGNEDKLEAGTLFNKMGVAYNEMGNYAEAECRRIRNDGLVAHGSTLSR